MTEEALEDVPMECKGVVGGWIGERGAQIGAQINDAGDRVHDAAQNIADDIVSDVDGVVNCQLFEKTRTNGIIIVNKWREAAGVPQEG